MVALPPQPCTVTMRDIETLHFEVWKQVYNVHSINMWEWGDSEHYSSIFLVEMLSTNQNQSTVSYQNLTCPKVGWWKCSYKPKPIIFVISKSSPDQKLGERERVNGNDKHCRTSEQVRWFDRVRNYLQSWWHPALWRTGVCSNEPSPNSPPTTSLHMLQHPSPSPNSPPNYICAHAAEMLMQEQRRRCSSELKSIIFCHTTKFTWLKTGWEVIMG